MSKDVSFLSGFGDGGRDNIQQSDLKNPYLSIAAKTSAAVNKNKKEAYIEGLEVGDFYNTLTKEVYGKKVKLIYLAHAVSWDEYKPGGGDFVGKHRPHSILVSETWPMKTKEGNDVKEAYNFVVLICGKEEQGPVLFTLKGSGIKHAKSWLNAMNILRLPESDELAPLFGGIWELESKYNEKSGNDWFTIGVGKDSAVKNAGFITEKTFSDFVKPGLEIAKGMTKIQERKELPDNSQDELEDI